MPSRQDILAQINAVRDKWGTCGYPDWSKRRKIITQSDVIEAGVRHACPVIEMVVNRGKPETDNWMSYQLKSFSFSAVRDMFLKVDRRDLHQDWISEEKLKPDEQTHPSLKNEVMYPDGFNPRILPACSRTPQVLYADLFRTMALIADGKHQDIANTPELQSKFELPLKGISQIAKSAKNIHDFTSKFAVHTADVLINNGVDRKVVLNLLVNSFAKPGLIKETGHSLPAQQLVMDIYSKMKSHETLVDFSSEFLLEAKALIF